MLADLELAGATPVLYFDQADADHDGLGYNVLLANSTWADRYRTLDEAFAAFRILMGNQP